MLDQEFSKDLNIPPETNCLLVLAKSSLLTITSKYLNQSGWKLCQKWREGLWNNKLHDLTVQNKFTDITELEAQNWVWNWIKDGLPMGQLSFLLRASDGRSNVMQSALYVTVPGVPPITSSTLAQSGPLTGEIHMETWLPWRSWSLLLEDILSLGKSCMLTFQDFKQVITPTQPSHLTS